MKKFTGFEHGMGIGGWLTNYKRFNVIPLDKRLMLTIGDFEHFDSYITEKDVKYIASIGADHIRLGFDQIVLEEEPYKYRERIMKLIDNFIEWCERYNVNTVLNLHKAIGNYCDIAEDITIFDSEELQSRFVALWTMIEKRYASKPGVAFELLNEVRDVNPEDWNNLAARTIEAIRELNPERKIIIGSTIANSVDTLDTLRVFDDENVIYTFHTYEPFAFTHQQGVLQWETLVYNRKMAYPSDAEPYRDCDRVVKGLENTYAGYDRIDKKYMYDKLSPALEFMRNNPDKILWCGEFGNIRHIKPEYRINWFRDVISFLKENEIPYCVWNYLSTPNDGNRFSLVDDDTREILSQELKNTLF